eukprot:m.373120 g.373120  ORF g.373120 m.373120 type:complete len:161 (+) comp20884_c0_seq3:68-550(+)
MAYTRQYCGASTEHIQAVTVGWSTLTPMDLCILPSIDGFKKSIFEVEDDAEAPCFLKHGIMLYIFVTLLGFSWAFRTVMASYTAKRKEIIIKVRGMLQQEACVITYEMYLCTRGMAEYFMATSACCLPVYDCAELRTPVAVATTWQCVNGVCILFNVGYQ